MLTRWRGLLLVDVCKVIPNTSEDVDEVKVHVFFLCIVINNYNLNKHLYIMKQIYLFKRLFASFLLLLISALSWAYDFEVDGIYYNKNSDGTSVAVTYKMFEYQSYSASVVIPSTVIFSNKTYDVTSIGNSAFYGCSGLTSVSIPEGVTSIEFDAFNGCSNLTSLNIPKGVINIGEGAFYKCSSLTSINIPEGVTSILYETFHGCSGLTSINIPEGVTSIDSYAFFGCSGLTSINIPSRVTSIGDDAFGDCSGLTSAVIPNAVTSIGDAAFYGCSSLKSVTIPNAVTNIGDYTFYNCSSLKSVTIPNAVTSIGNGAFRRCSGLTSINIPEGVTSIGDYSFSGCSGLTSINIPEGVTNIGIYSFSGCYGLTSINIPEGVTCIGDYSFSGCSGLTSINIPNSVSKIGEYAFQNCSKLAVVCLPEKLNIIKRNTFDGCSKLKEIVIPSSVQYIYQEAFRGCGSLESVKVLATTPPFAYDNTFSKYTISLLVPEESIDNYKSTSPWSNFATIKTLDGSDIITPQCSTPTIRYQNGQLVFTCETSDVEFKSSITDTDIKEYTSSSIQLNVTYNISVRATKTGYLDSDVATATLCWIDASPEGEGFINGVAQMEASPVLMQTRGNIIDITGVKEGEDIKVYGVGGQLAGSAKVYSDSASVTTTLSSGSVAIVKIGEKSVKIVMK